MIITICTHPLKDICIIPRDRILRDQECVFILNSLVFLNTRSWNIICGYSFYK